MTNLSTEIGGECVELLGARAMWWAARRTILIADLHLGKASSFRASGIPVPEEVTRADLDRLGEVIDRAGASRLVILGDLLHARSGRSETTMGAFGAWRRERSALEITLVRGNHDAHAGDPPRDWDIAVHDEGLVDGPFVYAHEPASDERGIVLCGHLHPAIVLRGMARSSLRAPCFWIRGNERMVVLPAFGSFTGMKAVRAREGDRVYALGDDRVLEVNGDARRMSLA